MQIDVDEHGLIRLSKVYNPVIIETERGHYEIAERDGGLEVSRDGRAIWSSGPMSDEACPGHPGR